MTTRNKKKSPTRTTKPALARKAPDRSGKTSKRIKKGKRGADENGASADIAGNGAAGDDTDFDDKVSDLVKSAYDALSETIGQGRKAAEQFRQGEYNFRQVPGDVEEMARRMLQLARQLSSTTFDVCEQLIGQISDFAEPPEPGTTKVAPFRTHQPTGGSSAAPPSSTAQPTGNGAMRLAVEFTGRKAASSTTTSIARPSKPTRAEDLKATPLAPVEGEGKALSDVKFSADLSDGGVIATVGIPSKQANGTYVGYVHTSKDKTPLGMLIVTLGK